MVELAAKDCLFRTTFIAVIEGLVLMAFLKDAQQLVFAMVVSSAALMVETAWQTFRSQEREPLTQTSKSNALYVLFITFLLFAVVCCLAGAWADGSHTVAQLGWLIAVLLAMGISSYGYSTVTTLKREVLVKESN